MKKRNGEKGQRGKRIGKSEGSGKNIVNSTGINALKYSTALKAMEYDETKFTRRFMHFANANHRILSP